MTATVFNEQNSLEDYFVDRLKEDGWKLVASADLERDSLNDPLCALTLMRAIRSINYDKEIGEEEMQKCINELRFTGQGQEGSKRILNLFKFGVPIKFEKDRVIRYVKIFDFEHFEHNEFVVSRQVEYQNGNEVRRADVVLYINGIPLVIIECKSPVTYTNGWVDAYRQIKGYERNVPDPFKYIQIGVAAKTVAKYFPIVPWLDDVYVEEWKTEGKDSIDSAIDMLKPAVLVDLVQNFIFFRISNGSASKVIARYMQYRAVNKIVDRVIANIEGTDDKNRGLIWHWQGSGKTFEMIFAANKLYNRSKLENPSIFFVVDRINLQEQLYEEFTALDIAHPDLISSIKELKEVIQYDEYAGKRGMLITLIQKFKPGEFLELKSELENKSVNQKTIMTRKNVIVFADEVHRTQYGFNAAQMKGIFKNAFFFGLTGTPISKKGRDTYVEFSYPPKEIYLDKYFILDSIKDGFTIKIAYQPKLEKEVHLNREQLDVLLDVEYDELDEELREPIKKAVKDRLNKIKLVLENPDRIDKICKDISEHFKENVDNKFKAMIVAASREACINYKNSLDKYLPSEYSEVVMTFNTNDKKPIQNYLTKLNERFPGKDATDIMKEVTTKFKEAEYPKILIVTDMLLTGFDAPILQTLYLDKPLKEHRLLQAIARTNRPFKDLKNVGLIIDYVGILKDFRKAFEMYTKEDISGVLYDVKELEQEFSDLIKKTIAIFKDVPKNKYDRETLLKATEAITSDDKRGDDFLDDVSELRKRFELLGSSERKLELFDTYKWIIAVHTYYVLTVLRKESDIDYQKIEKYLDKTVKYVYKSTEIEQLVKDLPIIQFDERFIENLQNKIKSKEEKAANIVFELNKFVLVDKYNAPKFEDIAEKVNRLVIEWSKRNKDFEKLYLEGTRIVNEINKITERQHELGFSDLQYSILAILEKKFGQDKQLIDDVKDISTAIESRRFSGWLSQKTSAKEVEREIRKSLRKYVPIYGLSLNDIDLLSKKIIDSVRLYGE